MPPYSPSVIANEFLKRSGRDGKPITPMQIQKLVYIAHGWNLAVTEAPLIDEAIEAWKYGPVVPSLFHTFKLFGGAQITKLACEPITTGTASDYPELAFDTDAPFLPEEDTSTAELLDWVWTEYAPKSGWQLSLLTNQPDTPWSLTVGRNPGVRNPDIDNDLIREHYLKLWAKRDAG